MSIIGNDIRDPQSTFDKLCSGIMIVAKEQALHELLSLIRISTTKYPRSKGAISASSFIGEGKYTVPDMNFVLLYEYQVGDKSLSIIGQFADLYVILFYLINFRYC